MEPYNQPPFTFPSRKSLVNQAQGLLKLAQQQKVLSTPVRGFESNIDFNLYLGQACMPVTLNKDRIDFHPVLPTSSSVYVQPGLKEGMYELATLTNDEDTIKKVLSANNRLRVGQYQSAEYILGRSLTAEEISSRTITPNPRQSATGLSVDQNFRTSAGQHAHGTPLGRQTYFEWAGLRQDQKESILSLLGTKTLDRQYWSEKLKELNLRLSLTSPLDWATLSSQAFQPNTNWHMILTQVVNGLAGAAKSSADVISVNEMRAHLQRQSDIFKSQNPDIATAPPMAGANTQPAVNPEKPAEEAKVDSEAAGNETGTQNIDAPKTAPVGVVPPSASAIEVHPVLNDNLVETGHTFAGTSSIRTDSLVPVSEIADERPKKGNYNTKPQPQPQSKPQTRSGGKKGSGIKLNYKHRHLAEHIGGKIDSSEQEANIMEDSATRPVATQGLTDSNIVQDSEQQLIQYETYRQEAIDDAVNDFVPLKSNYRTNEIIANRMNKRARDAERIDNAGYSATSSGTATNKKRAVREVTLPYDTPHSTLSITGYDSGAVFSGHLMRGTEAVPRALQVQVPEQHVSNEAPLRQRAKYPRIAEKVTQEITPTQLSRKKTTASIDDSGNFKNQADLGQFGKYLLNWTELKKKLTNIRLKPRSGRAIEMKIPSELGRHLLNLRAESNSGGKIKAKHIHELAKKSRVLFKAMSRGAGLKEVGDINVPKKERMKIIAGEIEAGNDNPLLRAELKATSKEPEENPWEDESALDRKIRSEDRRQEANSARNSAYAKTGSFKGLKNIKGSTY